MKFFIPDEPDPAKAEETWQATKRFVEQVMGGEISNRRIFRVTYQHNGTTHRAEVGKQIKRENKSGQLRAVAGEPVIAILESGIYLICTPTRGVLRGMPLLVPPGETTWAEDFEP